MSEHAWRPMSEAPRDGSSFDVKCRSEDGVEVVVHDLHFAPRSMWKFRRDLILWGAKNPLSPYLTPIGWRSRSGHG